MPDPDISSDKKTFWARVTHSVKTYSDVTGLSDVQRLVPIVQWLPQYNRKKLVGDAVAGITVGVMLVPQAMAYANLSGLPPVFGLYSAFMSLFVYTIFGTAKDVSLGPTALMSLIVADSFTELDRPPSGFQNDCSDIQSYEFCCVDGDDFACTPVHLVVAATLMSGLKVYPFPWCVTTCCDTPVANRYQIAMGFLNFGAVVDFIGFPVFNGFTTAAAVSILTNQVRHILGLTNVDRRWLFTLRDIFSQLDQSRWQDFVMGTSCIILTVALEKIKNEYNDRRTFSKREYVLWLAGTARNAITVILALIVARIVAASGAGDKVFKLVYTIPSGIPTPQDPLSGVSSDEMSEVLTASVTIALLGYLESIAIGKSFAQKNGYTLDPTQEVRVLGYASVVSSFFSSVPITASFSRSAVNSASAMYTPLGGTITALCVIFSLELVTPAFYYVPKASLAAIIITAVFHMLDIAQVKRMAKVNPQDLLIWLVSFLACLLWSLEYGILLAVGVSACLTLYNQSIQTFSRLRFEEEIEIWVADPLYTTEGLSKKWAPIFVEGASQASPLVVRCGGDITFSMANEFKDRVLAVNREYQSEDEVRALVIDMSAVNRIDYTGVLAFEAILEALKPQTRLCVASGGELESGNQTLTSFKKGDVYEQHVKGIRLHLAHVLPSAHRALQRAGITNGSLGHGEWTITMHLTVDMAILSMPDDFRKVDSTWPFDWHVPSRPAKLYAVGHVEPGRSASLSQWVCDDVSGKKRWVRSFEAAESSTV